MLSRKDERQSPSCLLYLQVFHLLQQTPAVHQSQFRGWSCCDVQVSECASHAFCSHCTKTSAKKREQLLSTSRVQTSSEDVPPLLFDGSLAISAMRLCTMDAPNLLYSGASLGLTIRNLGLSCVESGKAKATVVLYTFQLKSAQVRFIGSWA